MAERRRRPRDARYAQPRRTAQMRYQREGAIAPLDVSGIEDLSEILQGLGDAAFGGSLKSAAIFAMTVVHKKAKANALNFENSANSDQPHQLDTGRIVVPPFTSTMVKKKSRLSKDKNAAWSDVGVHPDAYYAVQFVERGYTRVNGKNIPAQPWLVPAFDQAREEIVKRFGLKMSKGIDKAIKKRGGG